MSERDEVMEKFKENNKHTWDLVVEYVEQLKEELAEKEKNKT